MATGARGGERPQQNGNPPEEGSMEQMYDGVEVPQWTDHVTPRAIVVSIMIALPMSFMMMRMDLMGLYSDNLNVYNGISAFFLLKAWTSVMEMSGFLRTPFTRQENTVIHACVVACVSIICHGGFGTYFAAMDPDLPLNHGVDKRELKDIKTGWIILFLFLTSFIGIFTVVPLAKVLLIRHQLIYPTGTTMAQIINSFHVPQPTSVGRQQRRLLFQSIAGSVSWGCFSWFYSGGPGCGFQGFPLFGIKATRLGFLFDFSTAAIGVGMAIPPVVGFSALLGGVLGWLVLWPFFAGKAGEWYPADLSYTDMHGMQGYKTFLSVALIATEGLCHMLVVVLQVCYEHYIRRKQKHLIIPFNLWTGPEIPSMSYDDRRRTNLFIQDQVPITVALGGYILFALISAVIIPIIFPSLRFVHILVAYLLAPWLSYCNAYTCGLMDTTATPILRKLSIFIFGGLVAHRAGGTLSTLAACGVVSAVASAAADLMLDFKIGFLTMTSPRSMFVSQIVGTAMGCITAPLVFYFFDNPIPAGSPGSPYPLPHAVPYRSLSKLSVDGGDAELPKHLTTVVIVAILLTIALNVLKEVSRAKKWGIERFTPNLVAVSLGMFLNGSISVDMTIGSLIALLWRRSDARQAALFMPVLAFGMQAGEAMWSLPSQLLSDFSRNPPICVKFMSAEGATNANLLLSKLS